MSFDKIKAMRNAERFLSQGKIRAAISEYQRVVENDPRDFSTLNILGDLYAKNAETKQAVGCFTQVAEHYNTQGFAHKAIAVYNKISRIEPQSMEVAAKLAQLYQSKGSISEARTHYNALAEQYQRKGQKIEALAIWKKIAELDPNNTDIYLKIADVCWQEDQFDEAAKAFTEAGLRLSEREQFEAALTAFSKALEIKKYYLRALKGMVEAQIGLGCADEAAKMLENILEEQPYNRNILLLLVDCYLDLKDTQAAENAVIKLVEQEPANYPKFLELIKIYVKSNDLESAVRILSLSSEHLLVGGQSDDFLRWTEEVLTRNPEQLEALQLLVRYYGWQRNEKELESSLNRLAETAHLVEDFEKERYALSQLVQIAPQDAEYARRLQEVNGKYQFETDSLEKETSLAGMPHFENFSADETGATTTNGHFETAEAVYGNLEFADADDSFEYQSADAEDNEFSEAVKEFDFYADKANIVEDEIQPVEVSPVEPEAVETNGKLKLADELNLQKEIESVEFYIAQGYTDFALKSLEKLEEEYGKRAELNEIRLQLENTAPPSVEADLSNVEIFESPTIETIDPPVKKITDPPSVEVIETETPEEVGAKDFDIIDDLRNELGFEETENVEEGDYETHYHTAVAYQEMGLMENAIREFQDAINVVSPDDGTRRFFKCSNLLGHCFMEKQMPNLALMWYKRCLEVSDLTDMEKQALYYELGNAYEVGGDSQKAIEYFGKLYSENVDFRDVGKRMQNLQRNSATS